jgi:DNA-binding PadR family transcriptional regulator
LIDQEHVMPVQARGVLTPMALAAMELLHEGPRHPYEIHQTLQEREAWRLLKLTAGSLYHAIDRLDRDGLIEVVETSREGRRPERTTYRLTDAGRDAFAERLRSMIAEPAVEFPQYAVAIAFMHTLDRAEALVQLHQRALALEAQLAAEDVYRRRLTGSDLHPLFWADVELRIRQRETELTWTQELLERLEGGELAWSSGPGSGSDDAGQAPPRLTVAGDGKREKRA